MKHNQLHELPYEPIPPKKHNPFYVFLAFSATVALLLLSMQGYFYLIHPEPARIIRLQEIQMFIPENPEQVFSSHHPDEVRNVLSDVRSPLKQIANYVAAQSCKTSDRVCQSKAIFYFVRDGIRYVPDPQFHDELENPLSVLKTGGADCEDMAVLLIGLQKAIGNEARLVFVPGHAYAQIRIPRYKNKWLNMETTCKDCAFSELPETSALARKQFYEL